MQDSEYVKIKISDNGSGIDPEHFDRMFEYGFTTKREGHGFGLYSSAKAVKELGGSLAIESPGVNRGATLILSLPLAHSAS